MSKFNFKMLQNGSDIRGISLSGFEGNVPNLTDTEAERLAAGYLLWLHNKTGKKTEDLKISIGYDPRLSGRHLPPLRPCSCPRFFRSMIVTVPL